MFRLKLVLLVVGAFICWYGYEEYQVGKTATAKPLKVELAALEKNPSVENTHIQLGPHWCLYPAAVYEYEMEKGEKLGPQTDVNHTYFPVLSEEHPFFKQLTALAQKHGDLDKVPEDQWPEIDTFAVLIKTERFRTVSSIPEEWTERKAIRGLVINRIEGLDEDERELIRSNFPKIDLDEVLILEEGREPTSVAVSTAIMGGGAFLVLVSIAWMLKGSAKPEDEAEQGEQEGQQAEEQYGDEQDYDNGEHYPPQEHEPRNQQQ